MRHVPLPSLVLTSMLLSACSDKPAPVAAPVQPVRVITAGATSEHAALVATGMVSSQEEARLSFKTGGIIQSLSVDAGDRIKAGQILAVLDSTELNAGERQAEAAADKAKRDLDRAEKLFQQGLIAEQLVQDARTQLAVAESSRTAARFNQRQSVLIAPGPGVVLQRLAQAHELAAPGAPVLVVSRDDLGWVLRVGLDDRAAVRVRAGDPARVTLSAWPGRVIETRVREVGAAADPRTGTTTATITLPAGSGLTYLAGQVGEAHIRSAHEAESPALSVPLGAVIEGNGHEASVYVIDAKGLAQRRHVSTGDIRDGQVAITRGLAAGERVVSEGAAWLNPGMPVRILP